MLEKSKKIINAFPILFYGFMLVLVLLAIGFPVYQRIGYDWDFAKSPYTHSTFDTVASKEQISIIDINWKNSPLPIRVNEMNPLPIDYKGSNGLAYYEYANGAYIISNKTQATIFGLPTGLSSLQIGEDEAIVRVYASAPEMEAQQEPGFEGIAVFIAFAGILAIAKRNRKGG